MVDFHMSEGQCSSGGILILAPIHKNRVSKTDKQTTLKVGKILQYYEKHEYKNLPGIICLNRSSLKVCRNYLKRFAEIVL